jgi:hypothetical protein
MHGANPAIPRRKPNSENPVIAKRKPNASSRITNGARLLMADGRSPWSRRYRDIVAMHCEDLGGYEHLSQAELAIIRRAATLQVELEAQEAALASGEAKGFSLVEYAQCANGMRRLLETVGIRRIPRDCTPDLRDILAAHNAASAAKPVGARKPSAGITLEAEPAGPSHDAPSLNVGAE